MQTRVKGLGVMFHPDFPFSLTDIFTCGQAFRFSPCKEGGYRGIAHGKAITVLPCDGGWFYLYPSTLEGFMSLWLHYFDLDRDYGKITGALLWDDNVRRGIDYAKGIRILNQDPFETLISFIISANNNIVRIRQILSRMAECFGEPIDGGFAFPTPDVLSRCSESELREIGAGYRANYVIAASQSIVDGFDLPALKSIGLEEAQKKLCTLKGVGPKVADCILMFSLEHRDAFPVDTWVKKVLTRLYPDCDLRHPHGFASERFGAYAGYANQYLFHCIRSMGETAYFNENKI